MTRRSFDGGDRLELLRGLRILHLSDLHIDALPGQASDLARYLEPLEGEYDLAVITGDFRFDVEGPVDEAIRGLDLILARLDAPLGCYAVLGNHDPLDLVAPLEARGLRFLLNEGLRISFRGREFYLGGVDDPHWFGTDDLSRALAGVEADEPCILLAHSPELFEEARRAGVDLYLCGHTHGGQLCLPGGLPILKNCRAPRAFCRGAWKHGALLGFTSRGTGFSGLPLRVSCAAEIALITIT